MEPVPSTRTTSCPLDCPDTCTLTVTVESGRLVAVGAADGNPLTQGFICQKVSRHAQRVYAPERVLAPLVRTGPKGAGEFRAVSWDDALDLIVTRMRDAISTDGSASVVPWIYSSSAPAMQTVLPTRLFGMLGATVVDDTICAATQGKAWDEMFDGMLSADPLDVEHARLVVVWGANPAVSNTHFPPLVTRARQAGAQLVVVDPRRTGMAKRADLHLAPQPGTDVVLALAIARELARTDRLDRAFLDAYADGVDEFLGAADEWSIARASEITGVDAVDIGAFVELLAGVRPAFFRVGWGLERTRNGGSACAAVFSLPVLTGQFGTLGSGILASTADGSPLALRRVATADPPRVLNMNHLGRYLTTAPPDPPVRVLFVIGANPAVSAPEQQLVLDGLARDDVFTIVHDQVMTDTARFADVVLPATTHFEAPDLTRSYGSFTRHRLPAVIDRAGESRTNTEMTAALAAKLGLDPSLFPDSTGALSDVDVPAGAEVTRAAGSTVQFRDTFPERGRVRLAGIDEIDVPRYQPLESRFPLCLISPASPRTINSMFGEFQGPDPVLRMHPMDAEVRGLVDGGAVRVYNGAAELTTHLVIDADLMPGVVSMPKGLWRRSLPGGLTANVFAPDTLSDLAGGACFNDARVEVAVAIPSTR
jgi:anaerobic selenocysteine-containing dehydrogenase